MSEQRGVLADLRVLIVEDEALIAMAVEEEVRSLGAVEIELAYNRDDALKAVGSFRPDFAILDVTLSHSGVNYDVADLLAHQNIPFVFSSGYIAGTLPDRHAGRPFVGKPMQSDEFAIAALTALGRS